MSRIGKKPVAIPAGVEVKLENGIITVKGPKGELAQPVDEKLVSIKIEGERGLTFDHVLVRAGAKHEREVHLDTDEGNAAGCGPDTVCTIIK